MPYIIDEIRAVFSEFDRTREHLMAFALDSGGHVTDFRLIASGSCTSVRFEHETVLRAAGEMHARAIVLVHNHPSGDATPSQADIQATIVLRAIAPGVIHDHLVLGDGCHSSVVEMIYRQWVLFFYEDTAICGMDSASIAR